jgi:hypothetical protein
MMASLGIHERNFAFNSDQPYMAAVCAIFSPAAWQHCAVAVAITATAISAAAARRIATAASLPPTPPARHRGHRRQHYPGQFEALVLVPAATTAAITRAAGIGTGR